MNIGQVITSTRFGFLSSRKVLKQSHLGVELSITANTNRTSDSELKPVSICMYVKLMCPQLLDRREGALTKKAPMALKSIRINDLWICNVACRGMFIQQNTFETLQPRGGTL